MAEFLQADLNWRNAQIYLKLVVTDASEVEPTQASMQGMLQKLRLDAIPQVLVADGRSFQEILLESSQDADLIFLGIATPQANVCHYHTMVQDQTGTLPTIAFVLAAPEFAFTQIFTDEPVFHPWHGIAPGIRLLGIHSSVGCMTSCEIPLNPPWKGGL